MIRKTQSRRAANFRQWTRKSYAAFNSLKLVIKICVLSATYSLVKPAQDINAQVDSTKISKTTELEEVEVSGQRAPVVASQLSRIITVVSKSEIDRAPAVSVNDILRQVPQVDIRQRGANGAQADISIQGGSFDQTLILLNGINLTDPQTGHYNLTLPFDIESVDRIEVLKGPASRVYGTNAFSGAVNFITGQDSRNYVKASDLGGDFGLYRGSLTANVHSSLFTNFISVSKGKSNGYIHNTDYDYTNAYYMGKANLNKNSNVFLQFGFGDNAYGANSFYSAYSADQFDHTQTYFSSLGGETGDRIKLKPFVYWRRNYDHYVWIRNNPTIYQNFHFTDVYGGGVNSTINNSFGKTSFGVDYRKEIIYSSSLGKTLIPWKEVPGDTSHYKYTDARENISAYLEQNIAIGKFASSFGIMLNHNSKLNGINVYPGIDASFQLSKNFKIYGSLNRSLRLPTFTDLYYHGPQNIGNADLKPEQAWSLETGIKYNSNGLTGHLSYFYRIGTNIIDWVKESDNIWHTVNYTKLNTNGIELAMEYHPQEIFGKDFFINQILLSYSFTSLDKNSDNFQSYYALDNLRHKIVAGIHHRIVNNVGASWQITYEDRNGTYDKYDIKTNTTVLHTPYKPFLLVDGKVYYEWNGIKAYVEATNLFNTNYVDLSNIEQPGTWFKVGLDLTVGWK